MIEKITFRFLADPEVQGQWPLHGFDPEKHQKLLESPDAQFRTRTFWFDPESHLLLGYQCGCKSPKLKFWVDYPAPRSVPRALFDIQVPRDATLEVNDPQLGRRILSKALRFPDPRE